MRNHSRGRAHVCPRCNVLFARWHPRKLFCTPACARASRQSQRVCPACGVAFVNAASKPEQRFCSKACAYAHRMAPDPAAALRLFAVVNEGGCWGWTGKVNADGYGAIHHRHGLALAHRVAWEVAHGLIPDGQCVLHACDNPPCTNPAHLFLGTRADNNRDRRAKGRSAVGSRSGRARLTEALVADLRRRHAAGEFHSISGVARDLGVSHGAISDAVRGKSWQHVE